MPNGSDSSKESGTTPLLRRRVGRPRQRVLTPELIAQAALELLDSVGEQQFTIGLLAQRLKVSPSALYNHFRNKDAVMAAVRELISDRISVDGFDRLPWDDALREWAWSYRAAFAAHPITVAFFATTPVTDAERTLLMYEGVVGPLVAAGWPQEHVVSMMVALESFILGSALDATAPADMFDPGEHTAEVPEFQAALLARSERLAGASATDESFEIGLNAMLLGLREFFQQLTK